MIIGADPKPTMTTVTTTIVGGAPHVGAMPFSQLEEEWMDRNICAHSQILLNISPELQSAIDSTDEAEQAWKIICRKFESKDPSKVSVVRTRYENNHMVEGQTVSSYITIMREYRSLLAKMGEIIADSTHAATLLRNLPDSWRSIAQTIRMITVDPEEIGERLEAHKADLNAVEMSNQAATAFLAQKHGIVPTNQPVPQNKPLPFPPRPLPMPPQPRPEYFCTNCRKKGHSAQRCFAPGGGLAGQAPWDRQ